MGYNLGVAVIVFWIVVLFVGVVVNVLCQRCHDVKLERDGSVRGPTALDKLGNRYDSLINTL